jgi:FkbM family methyltransferase
MKRNTSTQIALKIVHAGFKVPRLGDFQRLIELIALRELLNELRIDLVIDVGANVGQFGMDLRGVGYSGWIASFEPGLNEFNKLQSIADPKWLTYNIALGVADGSLELNIDQHSVNNSFLQLRGAAPATKVRVEVRRLDHQLTSILNESKCKRLFLKMDTQGFDLQVFRGASGCLDMIFGIQSELSVRPIYESMPHYIEALEEYESVGFTLHSLHPVATECNGAVIEYNCLLSK